MWRDPAPFSIDFDNLNPLKNDSGLFQSTFGIVFSLLLPAP